MTDLETRITVAKALARVTKLTPEESFGVGVKIMREVVAEKDKRIQELENALDYNINELRDKLYERDAEITRLEAAYQIHKYGDCHAEKESLKTALREAVAEVVAEKDAEIARLRSGLDTLGKTVGEGAEVVGRCRVSSPAAPEQPRKVTDAQREAIRRAVGLREPREKIFEMVIAILESVGEPAAK